MLRWCLSDHGSQPDDTAFAIAVIARCSYMFITAIKILATYGPSDHDHGAMTFPACGMALLAIASYSGSYYNRFLLLATLPSAKGQ